MFSKVLSNEGILSNRTRVLVTHTLWCLPYTDEIFLLDSGRVHAHGTYDELISSGIDFTAMTPEESGVSADSVQLTKVTAAAATVSTGT